jgi:predicted esterase
MRRTCFLLLLLGCTALGCGSEDSNDETSNGTGGADGGGGAAPVEVPLGSVTCATERPPDVPEPLPLKSYTGGSCPTLQVGPNVLPSSGTDRGFILALPSDYSPDERLPVAFLWHWLAGSADQFLAIGALEEAANSLRFIAVIPEAKGDVQFTWPATALESDARFEEELVFFDDMLTCVAEQFGVNLDCVSTVGVSAGALWTAQLAWARSEYLASMISLSGGVGDGTRAWGGAAHALPALVVWGGPTDNFILNFEVLSQGLEAELTAGGHFVAECVHNCGHGVPPLEAAPGGNPILGFVEGVVRFAIDHPYWVAKGQSPWLENGLPEGLPSFCAIGAGQAVPRTGDCTGGFGI